MGVQTDGQPCFTRSRSSLSAPVDAVSRSPRGVDAVDSGVEPVKPPTVGSTCSSLAAVLLAACGEARRARPPGRGDCRGRRAPQAGSGSGGVPRRRRAGRRRRWAGRPRRRAGKPRKRRGKLRRRRGRSPRHRAVPQPHLPGARVPAVRPRVVQGGDAGAARPDAPRLHADDVRLRRRHADERAGRRRRVPRRVPGRADERERREVLELVPAGRPGARRGRAAAARGHRGRRRERRTRWTRSASSSRASRRVPRWPSSSARPTRTCSPPSACTRASSTRRRRTRGRRSARRPRAGPIPTTQGDAAFTAMGAAARPVPVIVFQGDADTDGATRQRPRRSSPSGPRPTRAREPSSAPARASRAARAARASRTRRTPAERAARACSRATSSHGLAHAWSGGSTAGTLHGSRAPDASAIIWAFFASHGT